MRYGWYTNDEEAAFLNFGFLVLLAGIFLLWLIYPSRIGVAVLGFSGVAFPFLFRPETFPALDIPFAMLSLIPVALLVSATHLRQRSRRIPRRNV